MYINIKKNILPINLPEYKNYKKLIHIFTYMYKLYTVGWLIIGHDYQIQYLAFFSDYLNL